MFKKIKRYIINPYNALGYDMIKSHPNWMSDRFYLSILWKMIMGYDLDWKNPKTYNEKLQWLKLYDHNPLYTTLVDKYQVKQWVSNKIGNQYVIPTLAKYNSVDEIRLDTLPPQFVLKCNHDSGSVIICKDKSSFDVLSAKNKLSNGLQHNFYWYAREWPYKNVKRCLFAEQYLDDSIGEDISRTNDSSQEFIITDYGCFKRNKTKLYDSHWPSIESEVLSVINNKTTKFTPINQIIPQLDAISRALNGVHTELYLINKELPFVEIQATDNYRLEALISFSPKRHRHLPPNKYFKSADLFTFEDFYLYVHSSPDSLPFSGLKDYKWFCFSGEPKLMYIANDRSEFPTTNFYDMDFSPVPIYMKDPPSLVEIPKPQCFEEMKRLASILSHGIPQVRVDFYEFKGHVYFGEMTFFHDGGLSLVHPKEWNLKMGEWIKLPQK